MPNSRAMAVPTGEEEEMFGQFLEDGAIVPEPRRNLVASRAGVVAAAIVMATVAVGSFGFHGRSAALPEVQSKAEEAAQSSGAKALAAELEKVQTLRDSYDVKLGKATKQATGLLKDAAGTGKEYVAEGSAKSLKLMNDAETLEGNALSTAAAARTCVSLPGTKIAGGTVLTLEAAVVDPNATTSESCEFWCRAHDDCAQAVFWLDDEGANPKCEWYSEMTEDPLAFAGDGEEWKMQTKFCGAQAEEKNLLEALDRVFAKKPWIPANPNCAWSGENCLESRCCADPCKADALFETCEWFTCWQKDEYFGSCQNGPAEFDWNGTNLGGHATYEVEQAPEGVLTQGTKLFCFCVVTWGQGATMGGSEPEDVVVNGWKTAGLGIMQCEEHAFFDGTPGGSEHNIDSFSNAWNQVKDHGGWKKNDWTVKVDADCVFFPDRMRWHIQALRTPFGSRVYLRNNFYKFHFMGAIEVFTKEAMATYFERSWQCDTHLTREGGEDYYMLQCMEGIGVNYQSDYELLKDKYAAQDDCFSDWTVAFHFYKATDKWIECHNQAQQVWCDANPGECPEPEPQEQQW